MKNLSNKKVASELSRAVDAKTLVKSKTYFVHWFSKILPTHSSKKISRTYIYIFYKTKLYINLSFNKTK